jgi:ISXO2-like transposase domain
MLENVQIMIIEPLIKATIASGSMVYTDEYGIYNPLSQWGYGHKTVCHGAGETMHEMRMGMVSVKFMSIRWRAFGHSCVPD